MRRFALVVALTASVLAGCGTQARVAGSVNPAALAAAAKRSAAKFDAKAVEAGRKAGVAAAATGKRGLPTSREAGALDKDSFQYGYALGLLEGAMNTFDRMEASLDVSEWKNWAYNLRNGLEDALKALRSSEALATRFAVAGGIMEGGLASFDAINGSFDVRQWKAFAYQNRTMIEKAVKALK